MFTGFLLQHFSFRFIFYAEFKHVSVYFISQIFFFAKCMFCFSTTLKFYSLYVRQKRSITFHLSSNQYICKCQSMDSSE
jgi:hypothetical protein